MTIDNADGPRPPAEPRQCYVVLETQRDQHGYIPSLVTEGQPGHAPLTGQGEFATPWYWGDSFEEAEAVCAAMNTRRGIDAKAANEIKLSSMFAKLDQLDPATFDTHHKARQ